MATTLKDIAHHAGVSVKTASRVLNGEPNVASTTRERVEEAATHLGYRPNLAAKGLASSRTYLLGVLYDDVSAGYIMELMKGATAACREAGFHLVVQPLINSELQTSEDAGRALRRLHVDGLILTPPLCDNPALLQVVGATNLPAIRLAPKSEEGSHAVFRMDDASAARDVTDHLIAAGHTHIAFIGGPDTHSASQARLHGYRAAMEAADLTPHTASGDFTWRSGRRAVGELIASAPDTTAIFAANDDMAAGVLSWMGDHGRSCPDDIALFGFDDTSLSRLVHPPLSTVGQDVEGMGRRAVELLVSESEGRGAREDFALTVVPRASTGN